MAAPALTTIPAVDPATPPSPLRRLAVAFAMSPPGAWFSRNVATRLDPPLLRATRGRLDSGLGLLPVVLITALGARSGIERTVPLLYFTENEDVILVASGFGRPRHPAWYHNLRANPVARLYRRGSEARYEAREVTGAERRRLYDLATQLFSGYGIYEQRTRGIRHVPVMRLTPIQSGPSRPGRPAELAGTQ
jgi:deazaflavin-dependent oxidoreductase (nitroreductase family)